MGVTELVFQLNYFKGKISAILKSQFCHSNDSYVSFFKISGSPDHVLLSTYRHCSSMSSNCMSKNTDQNAILTNINQNCREPP